MVGAGVRPICVIGMHRTGTSLVAGLLHRHGLWLGEEAELMAPNPYNPDGYFENDLVVNLNNDILEMFGGSWSAPPKLAAGWAEDPRLEDSKRVAREIGERLASSGEAWGFKDPRASLTLPFWLSVWGEMTVVVTVRNPLEAARSLHRRDDLRVENGISLWSMHYSSIFECTTPTTRIVVDFESLCTDPAGGAGALLRQLSGLRELDSEAARAAVRPALRHFRESLADLERSGAPADVLDLYAQLQGESINRGPAAEDGTAAIAGLDVAIRDVHVEVQRVAAAISRLEDEIGFVRRADLAGIAAQLEYQRGLVERIAQALPAAAEPSSVNGRSE